MHTFEFDPRILRGCFHVCLHGIFIKGTQASLLEHHASQGQTLWEKMKIPRNNDDAP